MEEGNGRKEGGQDRKVQVVGQPEEDTVVGEERGLHNTGKGVLGDSPGTSAEGPGGETNTDTCKLSKDTEQPTQS